MSSFTIRKSFIGLAAAGLLGTGLGLPAVAQAAPSGDSEARSAKCDRAYRDLAPGVMAAFHKSKCSVLLGVDRYDDSNWGDKKGRMQGRDNNRASSLINKGTGNVSTVKFHRLKGYSGGVICLKQGEKYADYLGKDDKFDNGKRANNRISSHKWTAKNSECNGAFMD
ncbi:hypothetical protein [Streptomyces sp. NPDC002851]